MPWKERKGSVQRRVKIDRRTPLSDLPAFLTREEFRAYMAIGRTLAQKILQKHGVKVGTLHRLPRERIPEILSGLRGTT
jgi:hypothetical protein